MTEARKSDLTRKRILDAGRALVLRHGFSGVGLARILAESGVPKGSFYYYFASKEAFGTALLADYVEGYLARFDGLIAERESAGARLDRFWDAWLETSNSAGIAGDCLVVKLGAEVADLSDAMRVTLDTGVDGLVARIAGLLREGARDGSVRGLDDPEATARMLYAKWLGAAVLAKLARSDAPLVLARAETREQLSPDGVSHTDLKD
ncbi:TetR/AcrR family transcriptional regulator [Amaricoccus tamworthensis]|uniref:TetR/AcrR family transcriptional regulator n=1 Tax=Amaricoccus tamworthensis TaxID=57002 RepID=UPI003C79929F